MNEYQTTGKLSIRLTRQVRGHFFPESRPPHVARLSLQVCQDVARAEQYTGFHSRSLQT